jgi:tetraprenyl-beta-curcumene synthase
MQGGLPLVCKMIKKVLPAVDGELAKWRALAERIPDSELKKQALASIASKRFHCLGGGVYALYPGADFDGTLRFIAAYQTISDYLDNLCDRAGVYDATAFLHLHRAMADALDPDAPMGDYYALYPRGEDDGYLTELVQTCRRLAATLPGGHAAREGMKGLAGLYACLQAYKHMEPEKREESLKAWAEPLAAGYPGISAWEFCAAAGSTLGVFLLFAAAQGPGFGAAEAEAMLGAYFPWVCGLHILLDYFIDADEDREGGDFNFAAYYRDGEECAERLAFFTKRAMAECAGLKFAGFHSTVARGLLALYLSDPKAGGGNRRISREVLRKGGAGAALYRFMCRLLRKTGKL